MRINCLKSVYIILIFTLAFALRLGYLHCNPILNRDSVLYCETAQKWHQTNDYSIALRDNFGDTNPGYAFLLKLGIDCGIPVELCGRMIGFVSTLFFLLAIYAIGLTLFKGYGAEILLLFAALQPATGQMAFALLRDPLSLAFYAISFLALLKIYFQESLPWVVVFSISTVLALFLRYEALELFFLFFIVTILLFKRSHNLKMLLLSWAECISIFLLLSISFLAFMGIPFQKLFFNVTGKFSLLVFS